LRRTAAALVLGRAVPDEPDRLEPPPPLERLRPCDDAEDDARVAAASSEDRAAAVSNSGLCFSRRCLARATGAPGVGAPGVGAGGAGSAGGAASATSAVPTALASATPFDTSAAWKTRRL